MTRTRLGGFSLVAMVTTLFACLCVSAPLHAQRLSLSPEIGFYVPTEKLTKLSSGSDFSEIEAGFAFGGRLGLWFGNRIGFEASGSYVPSTYKLTSGNDIQKQDAKLFLGSGQVIVFLLPRTSFFTVYLNGGVGVISHGGVAFTNAADKTDVSPVFGGGAGIRLGPIGLTAGAELFPYSTSYNTTPGAESIKQKDLHFKLGFGIPFGGH